MTDLSIKKEILIRAKIALALSISQELIYSLAHTHIWICLRRADDLI